MNHFTKKTLAVPGEGHATTTNRPGRGRSTVTVATTSDNLMTTTVEPAGEVFYGGGRYPYSLVRVTGPAGDEVEYFQMQDYTDGIDLTVEFNADRRQWLIAPNIVPDQLTPDMVQSMTVFLNAAVYLADGLNDGKRSPR